MIVLVVGRDVSALCTLTKPYKRAGCPPVDLIYYIIDHLSRLFFMASNSLLSSFSFFSITSSVIASFFKN